MRVLDLGRDVPYADAMDVMRAAMARVDVDGAVLLLLQHVPVITTTRTGGTAFVTATADALAREGIALVETDRGGDVTFHGPGQLVGYPVLRLSAPGARGDLLGYLRSLESALIEVCARLGVKDAHRVDGQTGVWCDAPVIDDETLGCNCAAEASAKNFAQVSRQECKLVAIGVGIGQGVTRHGFAINVSTPLERYARHIVPCGLVGRGVTSLERVLPNVPSMDEVRRAVAGVVVPALVRLSAAPGAMPTPAPLRPP